MVSVEKKVDGGEKGERELFWGAGQVLTAHRDCGYGCTSLCENAPSFKPMISALLSLRYTSVFKRKWMT